MWTRLWHWRRDEDGQGLMEYTLILMLVALASVAALTGLGAKIISTLYDPPLHAFG